MLWIPPLLIATREGYILPSPDQYARLAADGFSGSRHVLLAIMFSLAVYGPLIGALLALAVEQGRSGVRALLANTVHLRIAPRWYLVAFAIAAAIAFIPALIAWVTGSLRAGLRRVCLRKPAQHEPDHRDIDDRLATTW